MSERNPPLAKCDLAKCEYTTSQVLQIVRTRDMDKYKKIYYDLESYKNIFRFFLTSNWVRIMKNRLWLKALNFDDSKDCYQDTHFLFLEKTLNNELVDRSWRAFLYTLSKTVKRDFSRKNKEIVEFDINTNKAGQIAENNFPIEKQHSRLEQISIKLGPVGIKGFTIIDLILRKRLTSTERVIEELNRIEGEEITEEAFRQRVRAYRNALREHNIELPDIRTLYRINRGD